MAEKPKRKKFRCNVCAYEFPEPRVLPEAGGVSVCPFCFGRDIEKLGK